MSNPTAIHPLGRVVLCATGRGEDWKRLRDHLVGLGWQVDLFDPTPHDDDNYPEPSLPLMEGVDLAILLATSSGHTESAANQRMVFLAGVLKGTLGNRRVVALVENDVEPLIAGTGLTNLRYERNNIGVHFPRIVALLGEARADQDRPMVTPWLERFGVVDGRIPPEILVAVGALAVIATVVGVFGYQLFGGDNSRLSAEVAEVGDVVTTQGPDPDATDDIGDDVAPAAPGVAAGDGSVLGLPARCVVDTQHGVIMDEVIACDGVGGIKVEGYRGPWHTEIGRISLESGVLGGILFEGAAAAAEAEGMTPLDSGATSDLAALGLSSAVEQLVLIFTANGQAVSLEQHEAAGGNLATLTYALELG